MVLNGKIFEIMVFYRIKHAECNYELGVWFTNRPLQYEITLNRLQKADRFDIIMNIYASSPNIGANNIKNPNNQAPITK